MKSYKPQNDKRCEDVTNVETALSVLQVVALPVKE